ncbi:MAG: 50S ribosomal protein L5 [Candidatus Paceibacterota bacterium]|jgi:large subunit ribosomal protein L5
MKKDMSTIEKTGLLKIVVNAGVGKLRSMQQFDDKVLPEIQKEIATITGQKPAERKAKKSIATFKVREGEVVGLQVTLRKQRMHDFFTKVVHIVLPRVKDFRGLALSNVDHDGNLNFGFRDQLVFPEINPEKSKVAFGIQVTVVPKIRDREKAIALYRSLGVPLMRSEK